MKLVIDLGVLAKHRNKHELGCKHPKDPGPSLFGGCKGCGVIWFDNALAKGLGIFNAQL